VAAVVATIFGMLSWWSSRRSKAAEKEARSQADRATAAAEKAATAQQQTAEETKRVADVVVNRASAAELKPWRIEKGVRGEFDYYLVNLTTTPKYDVTLSGEPVSNAGGQEHFAEIDGHARVSIDMLTFWQTLDYTITIKWYPTEDCRGSALTQATELGG
jgi:hypothetical protein